MRYFFTGSLRASAFIVLNLLPQVIFAQTLLSAQELNEASQSSQWIALLHLDNGYPIIRDPAFILSIDDFSPRNELVKTLDEFSNTSLLDSQKLCRFIARAEYIKKTLNVKIEFNEGICSEYQEFRLKAPADKISIIYASENLTQPSSMLGHSMLAISGMNESNVLVEHGISFFTDLDSMNIASILWDTLYLGKKGHFIIEPLSKSINYYLKSEQRNIWQYNFDLTQAEKSLMHKHLWELRGLDIDYFFHKHNCATFSFDILGVAKPKLLAYRQNSVTPIDVVKAAEKSNVIGEVKIYPSNKWKIRMLTDFMSNDELTELERLVLNDEKSMMTSVLANEMLKTLNQYNLEIGDVNKQQWKDNQEKWLLNSTENHFLEINDYKSPSQSPGDAAYDITIENSQQEQWLLFGWLPASHALEDDNRQYFGETELKLSEIVLKKSLTTFDANLYRWVIYSAKALTPRNRFTGGLSGSFSLGFDQFLHDARERELAAYVSGSLGVTKKISNDVSVYYLANIGQVSNFNKSYAYISPEIGAYIYEIFNMKSMISLKKELRANYEVVNYVSFKQSLFLSSSALMADVSFIQKDDLEIINVGLKYKIYF